jgi:Ca2+-binding EF-hand superfamily protein
MATETNGAGHLGHGNALSQLQPAQVRTLRDSFQILDRDCDGVINREDVADMLNQLGLFSTVLGQRNLLDVMLMNKIKAFLQEVPKSGSFFHPRNHKR